MNNTFTKEENELYNKNYQKFMDKYNIFETHNNNVVDGLCKLIYAQNYLVMSSKLKEKLPLPNLDFVDVRAQAIYEHLFPKYDFYKIEEQLNLKQVN